MPKVKVRIEIEKEIEVSEETYNSLHIPLFPEATDEDFKRWTNAGKELEALTGYEFAYHGVGLKEILDLDGETLASA